MGNNICIIPARGGSKRIPRKNIKEFLGKPIIAYSIETAIQSNLFSEIIVSTDDYEIAAIAKDHGAKVPFIRSLESSNDFATLSDVVEEVKSFYVAQKESFDNICCILATSPFVTSDLLKEGYDFMIKGEFDSVRPVVKFSYPIQRALRKVNGKVEMLYPEFLNSRSQDLEEGFHDAGMFYWMKYKTGFLSNNKGGFEIPEIIAQDIDTLDDWNLAEFKFRYFFENGKI